MTARIEAAGRSDRGRLAVALAAVVWSPAGALQRQLSVGVATQVAGRAFFATAAVAVYVAVVERGRVIEACRSVGGAGVAFAACMAASSGSSDRPARRFPPEPVRFLGANLVRQAIVRKERAENAGRHPLWVEDQLAKLAPAGIEDKK